jgi:hypothetical protein
MVSHRLTVTLSIRDFFFGSNTKQNEGSRLIFSHEMFCRPARRPRPDARIKPEVLEVWGDKSWTFDRSKHFLLSHSGLHCVANICGVRFSLFH